MMRAFYNILVNGKIVPDHVGQDIADEAALRSAAATVVRALVQRHGGEAQLLDAALLITDAAGATLLQISFFEALYLPVAPVPDPGRRRATAPANLPAARFGAAVDLVRRVAGVVSARVQALGHV